VHSKVSEKTGRAPKAPQKKKGTTVKSGKSAKPGKPHN